MNKVFLIGRLTKDPELRYTGSNIAVATFSIAVNRTFTNQAGEKEADFINIVVWRKQAENVKNYLSQGSQVAIDGRIQTRTYDDQEGKKRYVTEVVADNVEFLGSKGTKAISENMDNPFKVEKEVDVRSEDVASDPFKDFGEEIKISDDDLPF
ncbi:MAG TPA: single-stranded DNA-binding protein [Bacilli bacterium]|nr:single-stranded DNA-binding protein [Bacilli bacterium]